MTILKYVFVGSVVTADLQNRDIRRVATEVESGFGILKKNRDSPA